MGKFIDLIGQKFSKLIVIKSVGSDKWGRIRWLCLCDCGNKQIILSNNLRNGLTQSCGCLVKEMNTKHGHRRNRQTSKIYKIWDSIIQRCTNSNHKQYKDYGGRGITMCKRWLKFENFNKDIGRGWKPGLQIDRIQNDKGYYKENCRWAIPKQNSRNRRNNHLIIYKGKVYCTSALADKFNIHQNVFRNRIMRGWSIEKALTTSVNERKTG